MKLIDSIHEASQDPRKAQEIASKSSIALIIDAVILAALVFGALWLLKSVEAVFTCEDDRMPLYVRVRDSRELCQEVKTPLMVLFFG